MHEVLQLNVEAYHFLVVLLPLGFAFEDCCPNNSKNISDGVLTLAQINCFVPPC